MDSEIEKSWNPYDESDMDERVLIVVFVVKNSWMML